VRLRDISQVFSLTIWKLILAVSYLEKTVGDGGLGSRWTESRVFFYILNLRYLLDTQIEVFTRCSKIDLWQFSIKSEYNKRLEVLSPDFLHYRGVGEIRN
jgi:hypothetical protein